MVGSVDGMGWDGWECSPPPPRSSTSTHHLIPSTMHPTPTPTPPHPIFNPTSILAFSSSSSSPSSYPQPHNPTTITTITPSNNHNHNHSSHSHKSSSTNIQLLRARRARNIIAREKQIQRKGHPRRRDGIKGRVLDSPINLGKGSSIGIWTGTGIGTGTSDEEEGEGEGEGEGEEDSDHELNITDFTVSPSNTTITTRTPRTPRTPQNRRRLHRLHGRIKAFSTFRGTSSNPSHRDDDADADADIELEIESELETKEEEEEEGSDIDMDISDQLNGEEEMEIDHEIGLVSPLRRGSASSSTRSRASEVLSHGSATTTSTTTTTRKRKRTNSSTPSSPSPAPKSKSKSSKSSVLFPVLNTFTGISYHSGKQLEMVRTESLEGALERVNVGIEGKNLLLISSEDSASDADMVLSDSDWLRLERHSHAHLTTLPRIQARDAGGVGKSLAGMWVNKLKSLDHGVDIGTKTDDGMSIKWKRKLAIATRFTRSTRWKTPSFGGVSPEIRASIRTANKQRTLSLIKYNAALTHSGYTDLFFASIREHWTRQHFQDGSVFRIIWDGICQQHYRNISISHKEWTPDQPLIVLPGQARTYLDMLESYEASEPEAQERKLIRRAGNNWIMERSSSALLAEFTQRCNARKAALRAERRAVEQRARDDELVRRRREDRQRQDWERETMLAREREERWLFGIRQREMERVEEERRIRERWETEAQEARETEMVVATLATATETTPPPPPPPPSSPPMYQPPSVTPPPRTVALPSTPPRRPAVVPLTPVPAYTNVAYGPSSPPPPPPYNAQSGFEVIDLGDIEDELGLDDDDDDEEEEEEEGAAPITAAAGPELRQLSLEEMQAAEREMHREESGRCIIM